MADGYVTHSPDGVPLMFRDSHMASVNFGLGEEWWSSVPKSKFMFYVRFVRPNSSGNSSQQTTNQTDYTRNLGIVVKNVDRPNINFDTEVLNQYNKKRVVQKKVTYSPIKIQFHDTVNNRANNLFQEYFRFYYGDAKAKSASDWSWDINTDQFKNNEGGTWGFTPPKESPDFAYFFSQIEIYELFGGQYRRVDLVNPKISSYNQSNLDYSEGNGILSIEMEIVYEGVVFQGNNLNLADSPGLIEEMGLDMSSFYQPEDDMYSSGMSYNTLEYNLNGFNLSSLVNNPLPAPRVIMSPVAPTYPTSSNPLASIVGNLNFDGNSDEGITSTTSLNDNLASRQIGTE